MFFQLPVELQLITFSYLTPTELLKLEPVCQRFKNLCEDEGLSRSFSEKARALSTHTGKKVLEGVPPIRQYKILTAHMKKQYNAKKIAMLFKSVVTLLEEEHEKILTHLLVHEDSIELSGTKNTYGPLRRNASEMYDFSTIEKIILKQKDPIELKIEGLNLEKENLIFLKPLIEKRKISSLILTQGKIDTITINWLKEKMNFMEDQIDDSEGVPENSLIFLAKIHC